MDPALRVLISIIICTRDRASDLQATLASMAQVKVPDGVSCELIVVDNASMDHTAELVQKAILPNMPLRYLYEARQGKGNAYNTGVAAAQGQIILFTDDDVRLPHEWIESMCAPILSKTADAVAGGIRIAPHLERPWMVGTHRACLASTEWMNPRDPEILIFANAAVSRRVFSTVPLFDPELGPGALGFCDDSLFSMQIREAGYKCVSNFEVQVEHHFQESRLMRSALVDRMIKDGHSHAYIAYHWQHREIAFAGRHCLKLMLKYTRWRIQNLGRWHFPEGMPAEEMGHIREISFFKQYLRESKRPRNYEKRGLMKLKH